MSFLVIPSTETGPATDETLVKSELHPHFVAASRKSAAHMRFRGRRSAETPLKGINQSAGVETGAPFTRHFIGE